MLCAYFACKVSNIFLILQVFEDFFSISQNILLLFFIRTPLAEGDGVVLTKCYGQTVKFLIYLGYYGFHVGIEPAHLLLGVAAALDAEAVYAGQVTVQSVVQVSYSDIPPADTV